MSKNRREANARYHVKRSQARKEAYAAKKLEEQQTQEPQEQPNDKLEAHKRTTGWKNEKAKSRAWAFVAYPESAPENWRDIIQQTGLGFAISPLHDSDKDPTEEDKKPHWHVIAVWEGGSTTGTVAKRITDSINAPLPIPLNSIKGYYRYLTHKDNPDKFQYDEKDVQTLNGFNIADHAELTKSEVNEIKRGLQAFIVEHNIIEYAVLMDYLMDEGLITEYDVASGNTYFFDKYISSRRNMQKAERMGGYELVKVDQETGEVLE